MAQNKASQKAKILSSGFKSYITPIKVPFPAETKWSLDIVSLDADIIKPEQDASLTDQAKFYIQDHLLKLQNTINRNKQDGTTKTFGIRPKDRRRHMYIVGKSGMGKSTLMENMILQDIYAGKGVCFIDPLGDSAQKIIDHIPAYRHKDVVYIDPSDVDNPVGINILEADKNQPPFLIATQVLDLLNKIWAGAWSGRMEYFLNNALLALLEVHGNTFLGVSKMFTDKQFRKFIVENTENVVVKSFWENEYMSYSDSYKNEAAGAIINKVNQFLSSKMMRGIMGLSRSTINFRDVMDQQKILIVNLSKGKIGGSNSRLLGGLIVTKLLMAAMSRVDTPESERKDFYFYVDEFQNVISSSFSTILSEARKYRLNLILANQFLGQFEETENQAVMEAIFGNVGTLVSFQIGANDAEVFAKQMFPDLEDAHSHFLGLDRGQIFIKLFLETKNLYTFFANTLPPLYSEFKGNSNKVIRSSREQFTRPADVVNAEIDKYFAESVIYNQDGTYLRARVPKRRRKRKEKPEEN